MSEEKDCDTVETPIKQYKEINIICFNTCLLPYGLSNAGSGDDKNELRLELFFMKYGGDADVLLLSEVWDSLSFNLYKVIKTAKRYGFIYNFHKKIEWYQLCNNGLIIFSKHPIKKIDYITFSSSCGFQWFVPNGAISAEIEFKKDDGEVENVLFFTTHIHAGPLDTSCCNSVSKSKIVQKEQITELRKFINNKEKIKWICAGDFNVDANNTISSQYNLEYYCLKNIMGESLLKTKNFPVTYPVPEEGSFLVNNSFLGEKTCIDHCFSNFEEGVEVDVKYLQVDGIPLSDHASIFIKLHLK